MPAGSAIGIVGELLLAVEESAHGMGQNHESTTGSVGPVNFSLVEFVRYISRRQLTRNTTSPLPSRHQRSHSVILFRSFWYSLSLFVLYASISNYLTLFIS